MVSCNQWHRTRYHRSLRRNVGAARPVGAQTLTASSPFYPWRL
jgi:hypothetical protein